MKKINVLVYPCGSEIGLEINQALRYEKNIELFGVSSEQSNHGKYVYKNYSEDLPYYNSPDFITKLNEYIKSHSIDFIFPAHDYLVLFLAENQNKINATIIGSPKKTASICRSKRSTYQYFKNDLTVPEEFNTIESISTFPVFLKPDIGQGSRGTHTANNTDEVGFYLNEDPSLMILEYLPGEEFTVDCFTDRHGTLRFCSARKRVRISNGIAVDTVPVIDEASQFNTFAQKINSHLVFRGVWFFQVKINRLGKISLMEIAPRVAGSMALFRNLGINLPLLSLYDAMDQDVSFLTNNFAIEMDRALSNSYKTNLNYKHIYVDLDDTILINNKLNTKLISLLYQSLNRNIRIHLLTRSQLDVDDVLKKYRISNLFDSITIVPMERNKSRYITHKNSVFIDDSFRERIDVSTVLHIPVFGPGEIESLINSEEY